MDLLATLRWLSLSAFLTSVLTTLPTRARAMTSERAGVHGPEMYTDVKIFVNYSANGAISTDNIAFRNSIYLKGPGSGSVSGTIISSSRSAPSIGASSSAGLGVPPSALSSLSLTENTVSAFGGLVHVINYKNSKMVHDACTEVVNPLMNKPWIALLRDDGECSQDTKLEQVFKLNAVAAILYGTSQEQDDSTVIDNPMKHANSDAHRRIAVWLSWHKVKTVVHHCFNSSGPINADKVPLVSTSSPHNAGTAGSWPGHLCNASVIIINRDSDNFLNKTSVLFVSISFILLMIISLAWLVFYYVQRFRYIHTKEQISRRLAHLAKKAVAKIPVKTLKHGDKETDADCDQCAICIEPYKASDSVRILPCRHYFHKSCIDPWLLEQRSCPMCKLDILRAYGLASAEGGSLLSEHGSGSDVESGEAISSTPDIPRYHMLSANGDNAGTNPGHHSHRRHHRRNHRLYRRHSRRSRSARGSAENSTTSAPNVSVTTPSTNDPTSTADLSDSHVVVVGMGMTKDEEETPMVDALSPEAEHSSASSGMEGDLSGQAATEKTVCLRVQVERPPVFQSSSDSSPASNNAPEYTDGVVIT